MEDRRNFIFSEDNDINDDVVRLSEMVQTAYGPPSYFEEQWGKGQEQKNQNEKKTDTEDN